MNITVNEYSAVINSSDIIRVKAINEKEAVRQIARHCAAGETFTVNGKNTYRVNGKLSNVPATKVKGA